MAKNALGFKGNTYNSNWKKGLATFKFKGNKVRISMTESGEKFIFSDKLLPDFPKKIREDYEYFVEFNLDDVEDVQHISNIRPSRWMGLKMKCMDMTRPDKDSPPAPYSYTANYSGKEVEETAFYMFYECVDKDSEFYGCRFPNRYFYKFASDGQGMTLFDGDYSNPKATRLHRLVDHLEMLGAIAEPIEWAEDGNILPELLKRILAKNVVVETSGSGKYASITDMLVSQNQSEPVEDDLTEKFDKEFPEDGDDWEEETLDDDDWE